MEMQKKLIVIIFYSQIYSYLNGKIIFLLSDRQLLYKVNKVTFCLKDFLLLDIVFLYFFFCWLIQLYLALHNYF